MSLIRALVRACNLCEKELPTGLVCENCGSTIPCYIYKLKEIKKPDNKHKFRELYNKKINLFE